MHSYQNVHVGQTGLSLSLLAIGVAVGVSKVKREFQERIHFRTVSVPFREDLIFLKFP